MKINIKYIELIIISLLFFLINIQLLFGSNFIIDEDGATLFHYSKNSSISYGWNYFEALGSSSYYGDPGAMHIWSITSLILSFFKEKTNGYSLILFIYLYLMVISTYFLIKTINLNKNSILNILIPLLILISPIRYEYLFQRHWISLVIGTSLILILLYKEESFNLFQKILLTSIIYTVTLILGSFGSLSHLIIFNFTIIIINYLDNFINKKNDIKKFTQDTAVIFISMIFCIMINAWETFSIFYEHLYVGYKRDPNYFVESNKYDLNVKEIIIYIINIFHSGIFSQEKTGNIILGTTSLNGWKNIVPIFPTIFVLLVSNFKKLTKFERLSVIFISTCLLYELLNIFIPSIGNFTQKIVNLYPIQHFEHCIFICECILILFFLNNIEKLKTNIIFLLITNLLIFIYFIFILFYFFIITKNGYYTSKFLYILEYIGVFFNVNYEVIRATYEWLKFVYLDSDGIFILIYFTFVIINLIILQILFKINVTLAPIYKNLFGILIIITNIFLTLSMYPLNSSKNIWEMNENISNSINDFYHSRVAYIKYPCMRPDLNDQNIDSIIECKVSKLRMNHRYINSYSIPDTKNINQLKSFTQTDVSDWILTLLKIERSEISDLRTFSSNLFLTTSAVFNLSGTKYLYSQYQLKESKNLIKKYSGYQLFIYENKDAFDYEFFADEIKYSNSYSDLLNLKKNQILLSPSAAESTLGIRHASKSFDQFLRIPNNNSSIDLTYEVKVHRKIVFVILDAWHPLWSVKVDGIEVPLLKVNKIFKGVVIDSGNHKIEFIYQDRFYLIGIAISIFFIFLTSLLAYKLLISRNINSCLK